MGALGGRVAGCLAAPAGCRSRAIGPAPGGCSPVPDVIPCGSPFPGDLALAGLLGVSPGALSRDL